MVTDWRKINRLDRELVKDFKKSVIYVLATIFSIIGFSIFYIGSEDYRYILLFVFGILMGVTLTIHFQRYNKKFINISNKIDKLK